MHLDSTVLGAMEVFLNGGPQNRPNFVFVTCLSCDFEKHPAADMHHSQSRILNAAPSATSAT